MILFFPLIIFRNLRLTDRKTQNHTNTANAIVQYLIPDDLCFDSKRITMEIVYGLRKKIKK